MKATHTINDIDTQLQLYVDVYTKLIKAIFNKQKEFNINYNLSIVNFDYTINNKTYQIKSNLFESFILIDISKNKQGLCMIELEDSYIGEFNNFNNLVKSKLIVVENNMYKSNKIIITKIVHIFNNVKLSKIAVNEDGLLLKYVDKPFIDDTEYFDICLLAVKQNGLSLRFVKFDKFSEYQEDLIYSHALSENGLALPYMSLNKQNEHLCKIAIKQNPVAIRYVLNQTPDLWLSSVSRNGLILEFIEPNVVDKMGSHYENICMVAIKNNPESFKFVDNKKHRTDKICKYYEQRMPCYYESGALSEYNEDDEEFDILNNYKEYRNYILPVFP
jgi:hypothetical protein